MTTDTGLKTNEFLISGELVELRDTQSQIQDLNVKVTYGNEEIGIEELVSGKLSDGKFELIGTLDEPKEVTLTILKGDDAVNTTQFTLCPNAIVNVAVLSVTVYETVFTSFDRWPKEVALDHMYVYLKGYDHSSTDPERKFTITGDLSKFDDFHPELTAVWVRGRTYELDGSVTFRSFGVVLLEKGKFSIEGDIEEPMGVYIGIEDEFTSDNRYPGLTAILEPGVNYEIGTIGNTEELVVLADREGFHSKLVSDWMSDPDYIEFIEQQTLVVEELIATRNSEDGTNQDLEFTVEHSEKPSNETPTSTFADNNPPTDKCKHVDLSSILDDTGTVLTLTTLDELRYKIQDKRIEYFLPFIQNDDNLHLAWLAYELSSQEWIRDGDPVFGGFHSDGITVYDSFRYELDNQKLVVLEDLATKFSQEFVKVHITPKVELARRRVSLYENNKKVIPGRAAPPFTLITKDGESVSLDSVLQENELVLLNFWNRGCEPCIASIPSLRELYSDYHDEGFEIITVHLSSNAYHSVRILEENEIPWIDVIDTDRGDLKGWEAPIETSYRALGMGIVYDSAFATTPHGFLIDHEGCIVRRDLSTEELETALESRWSEESAE